MKKILICLFVLFLLCLVLFVNRQKLMEDVVNNPHVIDGDTPIINEENYQLSLIMAGDALYHDGVYKDGLQNDGSYNFLKNLEFIKPIISRYDLAYYNQESILGGSDIGLSTYPRFNSPQEVGDAFIDAGFNLVSTANNHSLDRGEEAVLKSVSYWKQQDAVLMSGTCDSFSCQDEIKIREKNGISYAFLSYTTSLNGIKIPEGKSYLVNFYSEEKVREDVSKIKDKVDVILVAMHWGAEYRDYPNEEQKQIANFLADLGVTVVIGTHPHVIQPIEKIKDTLVFYSLGNFISAQEGIDKLVGLMGAITIKKQVLGNEKHIFVDSIDTLLTYTYYDEKFRNFKIIPFDQVDSNILSNYDSIKSQKESLVSSYGIEVSWKYNS